MALAEQPTVASAHHRKQVPPLTLTIIIDSPSATKLVDLLREILDASIAKIAVPIPAPSEKPVSPPAEPPPSPTRSDGLELKQADRIKAADLRTELLMGKLPANAGLLIDVKTMAKLLNVSARTLVRLEQLNSVPEPVFVGRLKKWRLAEVIDWIDAGCPRQQAWSQMRTQWSKRKGK